MLSGSVFDANPIPDINNVEIAGWLMAVMYTLKQCLHGLLQGACDASIHIIVWWHGTHAFRRRIRRQSYSCYI